MSIFAKNQVLQKLLTLDTKSIGKVFKVGGLLGLFKIGGFIAIILMVNQVHNIEDYGLFEYSLGLGVILAILLNIGLQGAYPYFIIKQKRKGFQSIFYIHSSIIGILILSVLGLNWLCPTLFNLSPKIMLTMIIAGSMSLQIINSSILKSHNQNLQGVLFDGGLVSLVTLYVFFLKFTGQYLNINNMMCLFGLYLTGLTAYNIKEAIKQRKDFSFSKYWEVIMFGKNLVLFSFLFMLLTTGGRIMIEYFFGLTQVGLYTFLLRFATISVIIQQVFLAALFKKIYESGGRNLDIVYSIVFVLAFFTVLIISHFAPILLNGYSDFFTELYPNHKILLFCLGFHAIYWVGMALNAFIIHREKLTSNVNLSLSLLIGLATIGTFALNYFGLLSLTTFSIVNLTALFLAVELQLFALKKFSKIKLQHFQMLTRISFLFFIVCFQIIK